MVPTHASLLEVFEEMVRLREENMILRAKLEADDLLTIEAAARLKGKWVPFEVSVDALAAAKADGRRAIYRCVRDAALQAIASDAAVTIVDSGGVSKDARVFQGHVWVAEMPK